ncbi:hypothetical protein BH23PLA1_BH23PLA1_21240 [soil metagenome]
MSTTSESEVTLTVPPGARTIHDTLDEDGRYYLVLGLSEAMNDRIEELSVRADVSKAEIINRSVGLYKAVSDAIREGKRVGILTDSKIEFDTEFVGF